jgi:hypothetical protein
MVEPARELGIKIPNSRNLSERVTLSYLGNESYVIRLDKGAVVQLNRGMVSAAITRIG